MKKLSNVFSLTVSAAILFTSLAIQINAYNITDDIAKVDYSTENLEIYEKIEELAQAKTEANHYKNRHGIVEPNVDPVYEELKSNAENIRNELIAMGAKPSEEELMSLEFAEPMTVNGVLIEDFAEFEAVFGDLYDLWGVSQTVNASYGTYYTYDVIIQDKTGGENLASHISQNGSAGWQIFTEDSSVAGILADNLETAVFERIVEYGIEGAKYSNPLSKAYTLVKAVISLFSDIDSSEPITMSGTSKSYIIFCDIVQSVHFVYVRDSSSSAWQHTLTTNTANVKETHDIYIIISQKGSPHIVSNEDVVYDKTLYPENYVYRLTNAIKTYRNGKSIYVDTISGYSVVVKESSSADDYTKVFDMDILCPEDRDDLFRYGHK